MTLVILRMVPDFVPALVLRPAGADEAPARLRKPSLATYCWALLLARIYDVLPLLRTRWRSDYVCV